MTMRKKVLVAYDGTREGQRGLLEFAKTPPQPDLDIHLLAMIRLSAQDIMAETYLPNSIDDETQQYQKIIQEGRRLMSQRGYGSRLMSSSASPPSRLCASLTSCQPN